MILLAATAFVVANADALAGPGGAPGYGSLESTADREIIRRQEDAVVAEAKLQQGDAKLKAGDIQGAYQAYKEAVDLADGGDPTKGLRSRALSRYSSTAVRYAEYLVSQGEYAKAEAVAREVLEPRYNPDYRPAAVFLSNLEKPDYFNKTITPEFAEDRSKVDQLLIEANGFYDSGRYDMAMKRYQQVLSIDKYNAAALRGIEQVELGKQRYYDSAYNDTRSRMLWEVDKAWERPKRKFIEARTTESTALQEEKRGTEMMLAKLNRIIIPRIDFKDATVRQAISFLQQRSRDLDSAEAEAERRGVNIVLKLPTTPATPAAATGTEGGESQVAPTGDARINLSLTNVPLYEALRYVATLAGLKVKVEPFAVSIVPLSEPTDTLEQREFKVPPGFIPNDAIASTASQEPAMAGRAEVPVTGKSRLSARQGARQFLESQGVEFPPGSSANFIAGSSKLVVRNTAPNLDLIEQLVDVAMRDLPTQVEIESKFVEVSQNNLKELGFDWALGPFSIPGSDAVFGSGGTAINSPSGTWPFVNPVTSAPVGTDTVTSGLRSGSGLRPGSAVSVNSIDALLSQSITGRDITAAAPGIFSISGVFTNPQFQMVIRALNQKKGVDLMAAPKVTTKSGQKARIQITREFPYPATFTPPDVPDTVGSNNNNNIVGQGAQADPIVTPAFPTSMETRELGVILEVDPVIGPDGYTIDLTLSPQVVDFDGFVNYGSPIYFVRNRVIGQFIDNTIPGVPLVKNLFAVDRSLMTENVINQPIFSVRKVTTNVSIWDGQTVALGGLIREDIQKVNDKVPILGDIPLAGVAFRSEVDQKIKKNLIVFVTARLMDAAGQPLRPEDDLDQEEIVEPLGLPKDLKKPGLSAKGFRQK